MAQSAFETERFVELNKLLPDLRDFLKHVIKDQPNLSPEIGLECDVFILRLNAIIQPPSLPPRSRIQPLGYNEQTSPSEILESEHPQDFLGGKLGDIVSPEYLQQQRELSRQATKSPQSQVPYNSQRKPNRSIEEVADGTRSRSSDRHCAIYEKILSTSSQPDDEDNDDDEDDMSPSDFAFDKPHKPPPVPARVTRTIENTQWYKATVVMVHHLKDPLYSGLLRNVRKNIKQWGVIMSQKLYLFDDLERSANFIGDLRFYQVKRDPSTKNIFHVTGKGVQSIVLAAVNDAQYQLWYNAFIQAKMVNDAAVGKFESTGEMAEYMGTENIVVDHEDGGEENDYEEPSDAAFMHMPARVASESYVVMDRDANCSISSAEYEAMGDEQHKVSVESLDSVPSDVEDDDDFDNEEWDDEPEEAEHGLDEMVEALGEEEEEDYPTLPLPPLPPPTIDIPPELPERGPVVGGVTKTLQVAKSDERFHTKSDDDGWMSDSQRGSLLSVESLESTKINALSTLSGKLKRKRESDFLNDVSSGVVFTGILHKRKILAVWQKHYCKVRNEMLLCYRNVDSVEASHEIKLRRYLLDRADETWRKYAFKLHNETNVVYFAAENRADLVQWLNILAKEMNKERFVAMKDPDFGEMDVNDGRGRLIRQDSTGSESSLSNIRSCRKRRDERGDHTSDFDADNESGESEHSDKKMSISEPLQQHDKQRPQLQGYLFRKQQHHWARRWCCIKGSKLFVYRQCGRDLPEVVILMEFAALTVPTDDGASVSAGMFPFKITYEAQQNILFSTKSQAEWISWTTCIEEHIGSLSEEAFPYINVPFTSSTSSFHKQHSRGHFFPADGQETDEMHNYEPVVVSPPTASRVLGNNGTTTSRASFSSALNRREKEVEKSYYHGFVTKIGTLESEKSVDLFLVLTREKYLKLYPSEHSVVAMKVLNALMVEVLTEQGNDPCVLRLSVVEEGKLLLLRTPNQYICEEWKEKLNMIHYAEIEEVVEVGTLPALPPYGFNDPSTEKLFRKRSKSIDRTTKNEPVLISHSKTLPHMGKLKKRAKEQNIHLPNKPKRHSYQRTEEQSKKGFSSFIRSFTVDTLQRKAKNKTFDFSSDITVKETQHGYLTEIVSTKQSMTHVQRYCRISGKVLYCYASKDDVKHVWKVSLMNATIEDNVEPDNLFKIKVTALDTGAEYNFLLNSEEELNDWVDALQGEDKIHIPDNSRPLPLPPLSSSPVKTPLHKTSCESSPALSAGLLYTSRDQIVRTEGGFGNSEDNMTYDCVRTPSPPTPRHRIHQQPSPIVPVRVESRQSYKTKSVEVFHSVDRIPLSGYPTGIDKQQLSHILSNGEGAPPMTQTSPPVPRRMKNSRDNTIGPIITTCANNTTALSNVNNNNSKPKEPCDKNNNKNITVKGSINQFHVNTDIESDSMNRNDMMLIDINSCELIETDGTSKNLSTLGGSSSSLSSTNTTSTMSSAHTKSALSETDLLCATSNPSKEDRFVDDDIVLEEYMHEIQQDGQTGNLYRWVVLRKSVFEIYESDHQRIPCKVVNLENATVMNCDKDGRSNPLVIRLKDSEGFETQFLPPSPASCKQWMNELKGVEKRLRRASRFNSKLSSVSDLIKRRERGKTNVKSPADDRKSLCLVEDDFKAVQEYEESTDLSRTISGGLVEYFDDEKSVEKIRHCWIKDGFFFVSKESKTQKPLKKIDLSTVVLLDESDPSKDIYAFRLNYTKDNKERCIMLKAPNQSAADKWMVSVSMGILLHRLKSPQIRTSLEIEEDNEKDHEFVQLPPTVSTSAARGEQFELGVDIKREIAKKAEDGEEHFVNVSELLRDEFPTPNDSPQPQRKHEDQQLQPQLHHHSDDMPSEHTQDQLDEDTTKNENNDGHENEVVFTTDDEDLIMLQNIPDRDNAAVQFKNVRGILQQQESIRRAIIHRQKSDASLSATVKKKTPPKTKPKPKMAKRYSNNSITNPSICIPRSPVIIIDCIEDLSLQELQNYLAELESEKDLLQNIIRQAQGRSEELSHQVRNKGDKSDAQANRYKSARSSSVNCSTPKVLYDTGDAMTICEDIHERIQLLTSRRNRAHVQMTRLVSKRVGDAGKNDRTCRTTLKHYASAECLPRYPYHIEKGYTSEPIVSNDEDEDEVGREKDQGSTSIII